MENQVLNPAGSFTVDTSKKSTSVEQVAYNAETKVLSLTFTKNGFTYDYNEVSQAIANSVLNSPSLGASPRNELAGFKGVLRPVDAED